MRKFYFFRNEQKKEDEDWPGGCEEERERVFSKNVLITIFAQAIRRRNVKYRFFFKKFNFYMCSFS
jgi:hypothetical protein